MIAHLDVLLQLLTVSDGLRIGRGRICPSGLVVGIFDSAATWSLVTQIRGVFDARILDT